MNNKYISYTSSPISGGTSSSTIHISYTSGSSSNGTANYYSYDLKSAQVALDTAINDYWNTKININYELWNTVLNLDTIHKTNIPQQTEEALMDYVYELDIDFIEDMRRGFCSFDSYLQEKAYEIAEQELQKALDDDFEIGKSVTRDELIEAIVQSIDFNRCYEIIDEILQAPRTFEEHLRDIGMSTRDFL